MIAVAQGSPPPSGESIFVLIAQRSYSWLGLSHFLAPLGRINVLAMIGDGIDE
jgi:hypothetical protein